MDKPEYSRGFDDGRKSVLRKNKSGCCCLFDDDDNEIIELCSIHKEREERRIALALKEVENKLRG